jgi:type II secretory pathway component PulJ
MTLIELVVALAIFVVVIVGVSGALGAFFRLRSTYEQQMIVEQNFGAAVGRISQDMRVAVEYPATGLGQTIVQHPAKGTMEEALTFHLSDPANPSYPEMVTYRLQGDSSGTFAVQRQVVRYASNGVDASTQEALVTESMHQLVKLYFVSDGAKVVVIMVGETTYGGKPQKTSFTSLIYTRNTGYAQ